MTEMGNSAAIRTSTRLAALQMYDFEYIHEANDRLWREIARLLTENGVEDVPDTLTREDDVEIVWLDPQMLLSQTCGLPLVKDLNRRVRLVATPCYSCVGCDGPDTTSAIVVRADDPAQRVEDLHGRICVYNQPISNSGMNVLRSVIAPLAQGRPFFSSVSASGSHFNSLTAIVEKRADIAAIDCVSFAHIKTFAPHLTKAVRMIGRTPPTAGLPLVTSLSTDDQTIETLRAVLQTVASDPALKEVRDALFLTGYSVLTEDDYEPIRQMELDAAKLGYPKLR